MTGEIELPLIPLEMLRLKQLLNGSPPQNGLRGFQEIILIYIQFGIVTGEHRLFSMAKVGPLEIAKAFWLLLIYLPQNQKCVNTHFHLCPLKYLTMIFSCEFEMQWIYLNICTCFSSMRCHTNSLLPYSAEIVIRKYPLSCKYCCILMYMSIALFYRMISFNLINMYLNFTEKFQFTLQRATHFQYCYCESNWPSSHRK